MDLRNIMNADTGGANNAPPVSQSSSSPSEPSQHQRAPSAHQDFSVRPSQPPLQQPQHSQHVSPDRSSPYAPAQSPYQQFNAAPPPLNTAVGSYPSHSPSHVSTPYGPSARDPYGAPAYNAHPPHPAGPLASPYTPMSAGPQHPEQQSYFAQQRSHSLQTVMKAPRVVNEPPLETSPSTSQPPPSHQVSLSAHQSVPGTPLGPPPAFSSRQSPSSARPQSSGHNSPHNLRSSPGSTQDAHARVSVPTQSPITQQQVSPSSRPSEPTPQAHSAALKQEPMDPSRSRQNSIAATSNTPMTAPLHSSEDPKLNESPSAAPHSGPSSDANASPVTTAPAPMTSSPSGPPSGAHPLKMEVDHEPRSSAEAQPPKPKRRRVDEPPVYAQQSTRNKGRCPVIPKPQPPIPKHARHSVSDVWAARRVSVTTDSQPPVSAAPSRPAQTPSVPPSTNGPPVQPSAPSTPLAGSLGEWEPSITGLIPYEEMTKKVCDFLFQWVVMRNEAGGPAGSAAAGQGTITEVEAKLGHVMDMDRRERLLLPILTESVINRDNPQYRTSFESNMTVEQHRAMNNFLNETVKKSIPANNPNRIPISYTHKRERDTFYEVNPNELPPIIRQNLNPRHKPKVRVTTDQKTGQVLAKIIKCRLADMDVSSPQTNVDWRVSVNLEMEYEGDVHNLTMADMSKGGRGERNKDRMSYRHLAYQVDLTQVARAEPPTKSDFEHELEVEVSAAEIRRQGQLAMAGDPNNQYVDLVKGFVDNIRVLARAVPP